MSVQKSLIVLLISVSGILAAHAQDTNRVIVPATRYISEKDIDLNLDYRHVDTSIERSEIFHPGYKNHIVFQDLGNLGTASRPLLFNPERAPGFQYTFNPYDIYALRPENTLFYNTKTPYSDIFFGTGSNEVIFLKLKHTQNILPRWNIGLDYQRLTSEGFMLRQHTSHYNYQFFTRFQSKNKRYDMLAHATWNRGVVEENGGITSDSAYESLTGASKSVFVTLNNSQSRYRIRSGYVKQYFRLGKSAWIIKEEDSTYSFEPRFQFSHTFNVEESAYIFENGSDLAKAPDTSSVLLPNRYYDTIANTYDSAYYGKLSNRFQLHYFGRQHRFLGDTMQSIFSGGITHDLINTGQIVFTRRYENVTLEGGWEEVSVNKRVVNFGVKGAITVRGYNAGDHKLQAVLTIPTPWIYLRLNAMQQQYRPDFTLQLFKSNQYIWNNSFKQVRYQKLGAELATLRFRHNFVLRSNTYYTQNIVIAGTTVVPEQLDDAVITTFEALKTFQVWKLFFEHQVIYQKSSTDKIPLPEFSGMIRYYFQAKLFKAMRFQLGFNAYYNTAYYGNAYNPAVRLFYLQNSTRIGNYPVIEPFLVGEIKRATIFARYEHVNQDMINSGFYYTPHYPVSLSSFRYGVRWRFYD